MENYREKLKLSNIIMAIACIILAAVSVLSLAAEQRWLPMPEPAGDEPMQAYWRHYISGATLGILLVMLFSLVRNIRALKDERFFKKVYVKDHDERANQIHLYAKAAGMQAFLILGVAAAVTAAYFSPIVGFTIMGCVVSAAVICLILKLYYSRKF